MPGGAPGKGRRPAHKKKNNLSLCSSHKEYFVIKLHRDVTLPAGVPGLRALGFVLARDFFMVSGFSRSLAMWTLKLVDLL